jgi:hypothetical protein
MYLTTIFSDSGYVASNEGAINKILIKKMWKKAAILISKVLSKNLPGWTDEYY